MCLRILGDVGKLKKVHLSDSHILKVRQSAIVVLPPWLLAITVSAHIQALVVHQLAYFVIRNG